MKGSISVKKVVSFHRIKNKYFYLFAFFMVCAKGAGLDSSHKLYFVLSAISIPFWILHMLSVQWNRKALLYSMGLFSVTFLVTLITGRTGMILSVMLMLAVKDIDKRELIRWVFRLWLSCMSILLLLVSCGILADKVVIQGNGQAWHGMGYGTGNIFHASFVILIVLYLYLRCSSITYLEVMLWFSANYVVYRFSLSRSGLIMGSVAVLLSYFLRLVYKSERARKVILYLLSVGMLLIVGLSFIFPLMYDGDYWKNSLPNTLNRLLTGRIHHARTTLTSDPFTLFGLKGELGAFIDNAYVFLLMKYGIIMAAIIFSLYYAAVRSMIKRNDLYGIYMVFLFVLYGFTEQFFINGFMNYSMILVGNEIFNILLKKRYPNNRDYLYQTDG